MGEIVRGESVVRKGRVESRERERENRRESQSNSTQRAGRERPEGRQRERESGREGGVTIPIRQEGWISREGVDRGRAVSGQSVGAERL